MIGAAGNGGELDSDRSIAKAHAGWAPVYDLGRARRGSRLAAPPRSRRPSGSAGRIDNVEKPGPASARGLFTPQPHRRSGLLRAYAAQGAAARRSATRLSMWTTPAGWMRNGSASRMLPSTWWWRNSSSRRCRIWRRRRRVLETRPPGGEDHLVYPFMPRYPAARFRALVRAARAPSRLAAGIRMGTARAMGRAPRRARHRAPQPGAARTVLADPLWSRRGGGAQRLDAYPTFCRGAP